MEFDKKLEILGFFSDKDIERVTNDIWNDISKNATPQNEKAKLFILGGQPGAGKSSSQKAAKKMVNGNCVSINLDDYRRHHPNAKDIYDNFKGERDEYSVLTNPFMKAVGNKIIEKATQRNMNVIIEKTMNDPESIDKLIKNFKNYEINVLITTCREEYSMAAAKSRYENQTAKYNKDPKEHPPRWISEEYQRECMTGLGRTAKFVLEKYKGRINQFRVYMRHQAKNLSKAKDPKVVFDLVKVFDKRVNSERILETTINKAIYTQLRNRNKDIQR